MSEFSKENTDPPAPKPPPQSVKIFSLASYLNDLGAEMISPVWPLFVTGVLGAPMAFLGFLDGLGDALVSLSQAGSGILSDKFKKRKVFIWVGYFFSGLARIGYALSRHFLWLIPFKVCDRLGKMRDAPRDAMVADATTRRNRGRAFGLLEMMDSLGAVSGIVVSIILFKYLGFQKLFLLAAIPSIIAVVFILIFIKEKPPRPDSHFQPLAFKKLDRNLKFFFFVSAVFGLGFFSYSFLLIYAKEFGFKTHEVPILYLIFSLATSLAAIPFGRLADRWRRKYLIIIAYSFWGLTTLGFLIITDSTLAIAFLFVLYGLYKAALEPSQRSFVAELAPPEFKASVLGFFKMIMGIIAFPASLVAGILWTVFGSAAPFYLSLTLTLTALILIFFVREKKADEMQ